ncbi:hypothetical protein FRC0104_02433 [Corynebacterium diphtheriae]|nr:hypothetical protein FRC0104_02433 [Corynebacterium diphtheriae]CAB0836933.1 hypothetical protein FRC0332_00670 [Corynebacterium diphtheriae]
MHATLSRIFRSDKTGLAILATAAALRSYSYSPWKLDQNRTPVHWLESLTTPMVWGGVWALISVAVVISIIVPRLIPIAVGLVVSIHAAWCLSFAWQTLIGESPRAWVTAISYGSTSLLVLWTFSRAYPPPRMDIRRRE